MPVAVNDTFAVFKNSALLFDPLAQDEDLIRIVSFGTPSSGTVEILGDRLAKYTPAADYVGTATVTYTGENAGGAQSSATITFRIVRENAPPIARPVSVTVPHNTATAIPALAASSDPDGDALSIICVEPPANGTVTFPAGVMTYTPNTGFDGTDAFAVLISDGQDTSRSIVSLTVQPSGGGGNVAPVGTAGTASVVNNATVTIDLAARFTDANGDTLSYSIVTPPSHGTLGAISGGQVVYTPGSGYVGSDSFVARASDGSLTGDAAITITVTAPAVATFSNGYRYRSRLMVTTDKVRGSGNLTNFLLQYKTTRPGLKSKANGGFVESESGFDIRFEDTAGGQMKHVIREYNPATGYLNAFIKVPTLFKNSDNSIYCFIGKAGLSFSEADADNTYSDYLAVLNGQTGADVSGNGRSVTPANVSSGTALVVAAGDYNGTTSKAENAAAPSWLDGLAAITAEAWFAADATGNDRCIFSSGPTTPAGDAQCGILLRHDNPADSGAANAIIAKVHTSAGASRVESPASAQSTGTRYAAVVWASDAAAQLYLDGKFVTPSNTPAVRTGTTTRTGTTAATGDRFRLGTAEFGTTLWDGRIDEVRIRASALSEAHLRTQEDNYRDPLLFIGEGFFQSASENNEYPVGNPNVVVDAGTSTQDINVLAGAFDAGGNTITLQSVTGSGFSLVGGQARFTKGSLTLPAYGAYTIAAGGRSGSGRIRVDPVASGGGGGGGTSNPFEGHNGPMTTITSGGVTYNVPMFMRGWEVVPGTGPDAASIRFRDPKSKRHWNSGGFVTGNFDTFENYMGHRPSFFGSNSVMYTNSTYVVNTWEKYIGSATTPTAMANLTNPAKNSMADIKTHNNYGQWRNEIAAGRRCALGIYLATGPRNCTLAEARAISRGERNNYFDVFAARLKWSIEQVIGSGKLDDQVIVFRINWESTNQDTGWKLDTGNVFNGGLTLAEYNSICRHWINRVKLVFPKAYFAHSPAFETTVSAADGKRPYADYLSDANGDVGYNLLCFSFHPAYTNNRTVNQTAARGMTNGKDHNGAALTDGLRYWGHKVRDLARSRKIPFASLEMSHWDENNMPNHGPTRWYGEAWDECGKMLTDPDNYGLVAFTGIQGTRVFDPNFGWLTSCGVSSHPNNNNSFEGCVTHAPGASGNFFTDVNKSNWLRASEFMRKYLGRKDLYENSTPRAAQ